jgi:DNA-3-methyladenine glycosylase
VTEAQDSPAAVLIRALDPLEGVAMMRRRRSMSAKGRRGRTPAELDVHALCRGPGNLTMAMGITLEENELDLSGSRLFVEDRGVTPEAIAWGPRVGIRVGTESPWRAWVAGHPAVSSHTRSVELQSAHRAEPT